MFNSSFVRNTWLTPNGSVTSFASLASLSDKSINGLKILLSDSLFVLSLFNAPVVPEPIPLIFSFAPFVK